MYEKNTTSPILHTRYLGTSGAKRTPSTRIIGVPMSGQQLVGRRVRVWWEGDECFYAGKIAEYIPMTREHVVKCARPLLSSLSRVSRVTHERERRHSLMARVRMLSAQV